jgi:hypothetical protein
MSDRREPAAPAPDAAPLGDEELILYCYGEAPDPESVAARLAASPEATRRHAELLRLFAVVDDVPLEPPAAGWEEGLWRRLQPHLQAQPRPRPAAHLLSFVGRHRWLPAAAAAGLLLALGFLAGRLASPRDPATSALLTAEARQRILVETLAEHLERSQRLFTEIANAPAADAGTVATAGDGFAAERQAANELLAANRLYRTAAERGRHEGIAALLARMEPVLLDLANLPADPDAEDVAFLRQRIEDQGLLFKTRVASELLDRTLHPASTPRPRPNV